MELHPLLRRQLRRHHSLGPALDELAPLVCAVNDAYRQSDVDRAMLERALDLSSEELVQVNENMRSMFTAFPDYFFRLRADGTIVGRRGDAGGLLPMIGKRIQEVPLPELALRFERALDEVAETRSMVSLEYHLPDDERDAWHEARLVPLPNGDLVMLVRDITARRLLHQQLLQAQKMEAIGRLAGGIAHDFNNLLTAILGYGELVLERVDDPHTAAHVREIVRSGERAAALTRQLLALSRKQVLRPKVVSLNSIVEGMLRMLPRLLGENVRVSTRLDPALRCVRADATQIEQVILNLAVNSRDALPEGGQLTFSTRIVEVKTARVHVSAEMSAGEYAVLTVSDDGVGMDAETRSHVFEPFFSTKEQGKGTGLGLATVYGIVKQSGGYVWVESEVGKGTRFEIYLPVVEGPADSEPTAATAARQRGSETILVLEDEEPVRLLVSRVLGMNGYSVLVATTGDEAMQLAEDNSDGIDLLVADVVLPDTTGPAVAARLRSRRPDLKVLFMSGYSDSPSLGGADLDALIHKPFTPSYLLGEVRSRLRD
jgi:signal transduction histidine kinase